MRPITRLTTAFLSGLLILLGFGGCRSSKRAAEKAAEAARAADEARLDSLRRIQQRPQPFVRPDDPTRIRVLYGPPPARYRKDIK